MSIRPVAIFSLAALLVGLSPAQERPGYTDTPLLPNSKWRVHDSNRPRPAVVTPPGHVAEPSTPPADAIVLFDGSDLSQWTGREGQAGWKVQDGYAEVNGTGDIQTRQAFGDCQLHIEWAAPAEVKGKGQGRGNSGAYIMGRYEVQILDSFENETYADGQAAALYGQFPPMVNACRAPGQWQTYDIVFIAPRFDDGKLVSPTRMTVFHNGVLVHHDQAMLGPSGHKRLPDYRPHAEKAPLKLQDHGNPVRFRNIWIRELDEATKASDTALGAEALAGTYSLDVAVMRKSLQATLEKRDQLSEEAIARVEGMLSSLTEEMRATMEVKADGTWTASSHQGGQDRDSAGTWRIDGKRVWFATTTPIEDEPRAGSLVGDELQFEEEMGGVTLKIVLRKSR